MLFLISTRCYGLVPSWGGNPHSDHVQLLSVLLFAWTIAQYPGQVVTAPSGSREYALKTAHCLQAMGHEVVWLTEEQLEHVLRCYLSAGLYLNFCLLLVPFAVGKVGVVDNSSLVSFMLQGWTPHESVLYPLI